MRVSKRSQTHGWHHKIEPGNGWRPPRRRASLQPGERVLDVACGTGIDINPGMLAVARSIAPQDASIDWHEASAEEMPLPDDSIDVVLCQMGLQFAPDRLRALREMRRVLTPGGRLLLNLPGPAAPLFTALADALERNIGTEAAGFVLHVFSLYDEAEITEMMNAAGFREVNVQAEHKTLRLPAAKEFLWQYVHSTPLAGPSSRPATIRMTMAGSRSAQASHCDNSPATRTSRMVTAGVAATSTPGGNPAPQRARPPGAPAQIRRRRPRSAATGRYARRSGPQARRHDRIRR